jgi:hypothetical protein
MFNTLSEDLEPQLPRKHELLIQDKIGTIHTRYNEDHVCMTSQYWQGKCDCENPPKFIYNDTEGYIICENCGKGLKVLDTHEDEAKRLHIIKTFQNVKQEDFKIISIENNIYKIYCEQLSNFLNRNHTFNSATDKREGFFSIKKEKHDNYYIYIEYEPSIIFSWEKEGANEKRIINKCMSKLEKFLIEDSNEIITEETI